MAASGALTAALAACTTGQQTGPSTTPPAPTSPAVLATPASAPGTPALASATAQPGAIGTQAPSAQPRTGGTLRVGLPTDLASLDGHLNTPGTWDSIGLIYDRLTAYDARLAPQPMLAESWDLRSDYTQIKFNLRKGVQFHNGREFTSADVKYNLLRVRDPKIASGLYTSFSNWFTTVETPDRYTLVLKSDSPHPSIFDYFERLNMLDMQTMEGPDSKTTAVGTGPFTLVEWIQGDHLSFSKNNNYWQSGRPYLDGIQSLIRKTDVAMVQLEAGALDSVRGPSVTDIVRLKGNSAYTNVVHPYPGTFYEYGVNVTRPPLDSKLVRQALNYAIDRQRLVNQVYQGTAVAGALPWASSSPAYDATRNTSYAFDLDKSRSLLKEAGVASLEMDIILQGGANPLQETFLQAYQADLASIGAKLNIVPMDSAAWVDMANHHRYNGMYAAGDNPSNLSPSSVLNISPAWRPVTVACVETSTTLCPGSNNSGFENSDWTNLVAAVSAATDPAQQQQLYSQLNDFILDQCWVMPVSDNPLTFMTRSGLHGMAPTAHQGFLYTDAWLDQ
ncbi:MAG: ABC transporter substrate-binding protein [Chloroflexi bacterium]|nr:ABC transporter substrate-binding protein [Chloroflexota bacterium]